MKKTILILLVVLLTCGCVRINDASIDDLVTTTINSKYNLYNHVNRGYKYYLPRSLKSTVTNEYNEIIKSKYYDYYLYVDLVGYYNKKHVNYEENKKIYYSKLLNGKDKVGVLNVTKNDTEYLVQIMYNYAKIEVKCNYKDLNEVITNSLVILSSIQYVDDVITSLLNENDFTSAEEQVNIFEDNSGEVNTLEDFDDTYTGNEEDDYDPDVIKERG